MNGLALPASVADELLAHARAEAPNEACGLLSGSLREGRAAAFHPARNADASPLRYTVHPDDLLRITFAIDDAGEDVVAIFHSHTHSPAVPSPTDRRSAVYPDAFYLIAGLADASAAPEVALRAWRIRDGEATEAPLLIVREGVAQPR
ncbi:MAG TPA: M67 family metallopeptidase [Candidatus Limnocylindria bacterium]